MNESELVESAKKVLDGNWTGNFTIPSGTLYPHQWSWDSCFIAIGNSYFDIDRSMKEMQHLFDAQWKNGMIPHIVFNEKEKTYCPLCMLSLVSIFIITVKIKQKLKSSWQESIQIS